MGNTPAGAVVSQKVANMAVLWRAVFVLAGWSGEKPACRAENGVFRQITDGTRFA